MNPRKKSDIRFRHVNHLCDRVLRNLKTSEALILLIAWRHADVRSTFALSESRFAEQSGISQRQVIRILDGLIQAGALKILEPGVGTKSTRYKITGEPRGDTKKST